MFASALVFAAMAAAVGGPPPVAAPEQIAAPQRLPPAEYQHLPDRATCAKTWQALDYWRIALQHEYDFAPAWQIDQELEMVTWYCDIWWAAWFAVDDGSFEWARVYWANRLCDLVGPEVYSSGAIPSPLPPP